MALSPPPEEAGLPEKADLSKRETQTKLLAESLPKAKSKTKGLLGKKAREQRLTVKHMEMVRHMSLLSLLPPDPDMADLDSDSGDEQCVKIYSRAQHRKADLRRAGLGQTPRKRGSRPTSPQTPTSPTSPGRRSPRDSARGEPLSPMSPAPVSPSVVRPNAQKFQSGFAASFQEKEEKKPLAKGKTTA